MFTGIIERMARVIGVADAPGFRRLTLAIDWNDLRVGESVAVNGACLTIAELSPGEVGFDVIPETLAKTNLGLLAPGDDIHVERALRVGDRIDGHFVLGHIDGTVRLIRQIATKEESRLVLEVPPPLRPYIVPKGSVSLDGVSLTIANLTADTFEVALIPTTLKLTTLGRRPIGWLYNLETDIISKTVVAQLERQAGRADDVPNGRVLV